MLKLAKLSLFGEEEDTTSLLAAALDLVDNKEYAVAELILRECLEIQLKLEIEGKSLPGHRRTCETKAMLGGCLLGQKKYAEAELLLRESYESMKASKKMIISALDLERLVRIHHAQGKIDES